MGTGAELAMIGLAAGGLGLSAYGMFSQPGAPSMAAPPPPSNYVQYGEDGQVMSRQVFDQSSNTWITYGPNSEPPKPSSWAKDLVTDQTPRSIMGKTISGPQIERQSWWNDKNDPRMQELTRRYEAHKAADPKGVERGHAGGWWQEEFNNMLKESPAALEKYNTDLAKYEQDYAKWQTDKAARDEENAKRDTLRREMLNNLSQTPEDRVKAYEDYATNFANSMRKTIDPEFERIGRATDENANATGMFGSRAYADTKSELNRDLIQANEDISEKAALAKEQLASNDRSFWAGLLDQLDAGARADSVTRAQINKSAMDTVNQSYANTLGAYTANQNNELMKWQAKRDRATAMTNFGGNMAGGLLYLYGNKTGGGGGANLAPSGGGVTRSGQRYSLMTGL